MLCSQGEPVHGDILRVLDGVDALSYAEESCELPDFLNVRKAKKRSTGSKPATFWYDSRGQN
jgi:hypothetical protein